MKSQKLKQFQTRKIWNDTGRIFKNGLLYRNPILIAALGIYPAAFAGTSLKSGVAFSILIFLICVPVCIISGIIGERIPNWVRPAVTLILTASFYVLAQKAVNFILPGVLARVGICAELTICNSMIFSRANDYAPTHLIKAVAADAAGCSLGFSAVILIVSAVRELLAFGTIWGKSLSFSSNRAFALPFVGILCVGFLSAALQSVNLKKEESTAKKGR